MDFAAAFTAFMIDSPAVHAVIADRIHPVQLPQDSPLPALVYKETSDQSTGALQADETLRRPMLEIEVHGERYADARTAMRAILDVLRDFSGPMGDVTVQAVIVQDGNTEDYNPDTETYYKLKELEFFVEE